MCSGFQGAGVWNGPVLVGPAGLAKTGAAIAASQQFGALNQTDVFVVDENEQLNVFWVEGAGAWSNPVKIGPTGNAPSGAALAVSQQFGATNQTDVFLVDKNGQLNVFWVQGTGAWNGPQKIGPAGIAASGAFVGATRQFGAIQTDVFVINKTGVNGPGWPTVFWVEGADQWNGPSALVTQG
jgi:hypothetical protein